MSDPINPTETLPGAPDVSAADGGVNEKSVSLSELLSKELGRTFKDDSDALKSVKDTYAYVGEYGKMKPLIDAGKAKFGGEEHFIKQMTDIVNEPAASPAAEPAAQPSAVPTEVLQDMSNRLFYSENPDYKPYKDLIEGFGGDPAKVVQTEAFKTAYDKLKAYDENQSSKSVLQTSPRLTEASDKMSSAKTALSEGKQAEAAQLGLDAVMDATFPAK